MKLLEYFKQFLTDTVNLNPHRDGDLDSRVATITNVLSATGALGDDVLDTIPQGSWAHKTIIRPPAGLEFDADFLIQIAERPEWAGDPKKYSDAVWNVLHPHGTYGSMTTRKNRCIRVTYANSCHIDIVPYVVTSTGREVIVNTTTNTFEDTNPVGFTAWLQAKDDLTNGNLREAIRILKYLRDHRGAFALKSVLLTCLVGNIVDSWRNFDPDYYKDVPTTLVHLVEDLDRWLDARPYKLPLYDPSCPQTTFDHRWTGNQYAAFRDRIHKLAPRLRAAYDAEGTAASIEAWQDIFGPAFPSSLTARAAEASKSLERRRAPGEQFIEDKFAVDLRHTVRITCEVSEPVNSNRHDRRLALRSRNGWAPKRRSLHFKLVSTDAPGSYSVYWKVRNVGDEAVRRRMERGQIVADQGNRERTEPATFEGPHYVECYIVQNSTCVAMTREKVNIR